MVITTIETPSGASPYEGEPLTDDVVVTYDNGTLPSGCDPRSFAHIIMSFIDAFNRGDQGQLADFLNFDNDFMWYAVDGSTYEGHTDLLKYFMERHQQQERMQLVSANVSIHRGLVGGNFVLTRQADDLEGDLKGSIHIFAGKVGVRCEEGKETIVVWVMYPNELEPLSRLQLCLAPPPGSPENAVIAYARGVVATGLISSERLSHPGGVQNRCRPEFPQL